jgi:hypothetical protein
MPHGYDLTYGILVAVVVLAMMYGAFGSSRP